MAQTKRKRRSKHRGTPAGTIEARGRTGRPPTSEERKKQQRENARERKLNTPPTWRSSFTRASLASGIMFIFLLVVTKKDRVLVAALFAVFALLLYVPAGYYLEVFMYRRRQQKKAREQSK